MSVRLILLLVVSFFAIAKCQVRYCEKNCPPNEVFSYNASQCQNTCFDQNISQSRKCLVAPGCNCRNGFIRHQNTYQCIPVSACIDKRSSKQCPQNEFYSDCDAGCQKTCSTIYANPQCGCVSGCVCRSGYFRSDINQQCQTAIECQSCPIGYYNHRTARTCVFNCVQCKPNEVYKSCASCEKTCLNSSNGGVCTDNCREGCFCRDNYVRNPKNGECVLQKDC